jgi:hypothetical protein
VKAILLCEGSDVDRLSWGDVAPAASDLGDVVLRNSKVGLNHRDIDQRRGLFGAVSIFPHVISKDSPPRPRTASATTEDGERYRFFIGMLEAAIVDRLPLAFRVSRFDVDYGYGAAMPG